MVRRVSRVVLWLSIATSAVSLAVGVFNLGAGGRDQDLHLAHVHTAFAAAFVAGAGLLFSVTVRVVAALRRTPASFPTALVVTSLVLAGLAFAVVVLAGINRLAWV